MLPLVVLIPLFYYPVGTVLARAITSPTGHLSGSLLWGLVRDPYIRRVIGFTFLQAGASALLSIFLGLPGAYLLARYDFPGKTILRSATILPFVLPSILVVLGFVQFFGRAGVLNRLLMGVLSLDEPPLRVLYSVRAILLAHAFYNFPICVRVVSSLWSRINPHLEEVAKTLGARGLRLFFSITLPQILPAILAAGALIFLFCFLSFAVVLVLGGGPRVTTLEVEIYRLARVDLDLARAGALAVIGSALTLLVLWLYLRLQSWGAFTQTLSSNSKMGRRLGPGQSLAGSVYGMILAVLVLGPIVTIVVRSLSGQAGWSGASRFTLRWYRQIFTGTRTRFGGSYGGAILNSLRIGLGAAGLSVTLGTPIAWLSTRRRFWGAGLLEVLLMLPMAVSSIMLGLSYLSGFRALSVTAARYTIVLAHAVITYPFVVRAVTAVVAKIPRSAIDAAAALGATPFRTFWHIELPLIRSGVLTGAAFAFALSMGEINASLLLSNTETVTVPIAIYRLIGSYNYDAGCAMGTVLLLVTLLAILVIDAPERVR